MDNQVNHARAGMDVLAALQGGPATQPAPVAAPAAPATRAPGRRSGRRTADRGAPAPVATPAREPRAEAPPAAPAAPLEQIETRPRRTAKRLAGAALVLAFPAAALTGWAAWTAHDATLGGLALILGALSAGLWFLRVVTVPTYVSLRGPHLEVRQAGRRYAWDLSSPYSPVDHVRGKPGRSNWRVFLRNPDGTTFALDGTMVPSRRFTEVLSRYRPEL
ncbi:hypothetical protein [Nocardioides jiangxiensis]|uniref:PH domain-containing protein n=1 Tax=Nocardioides jiangxiensis TaxID=3064524 RepID=A0ABT9B143_9ACTN|nr:hypothetical protein [Nocardioides sp. WY-20]MDO7867958.1 hypothetical protein [Nocardioides sp. WY-20]